MRRLFFDLLAFGLLIGPIVLRLVPFNAGLVILFSLPVVVGFGRGLVERRFLKQTSYWIGGIEWVLVMSIAYLVLCFPGPSSDPHDKFKTVFVVFFPILFVPSVVLSLISYWGGFRLGTKLPGPGH